MNRDSPLDAPRRRRPVYLKRVFRWGSKIFWALWRIVVPLKFFEGVGSPLVFAALFLVSEWMTGYYLAFNFQVRVGFFLTRAPCPAFALCSVRWGGVLP